MQKRKALSSSMKPRSYPSKVLALCNKHSQDGKLQLKEVKRSESESRDDCLILSSSFCGVEVLRVVEKKIFVCLKPEFPSKAEIRQFQKQYEDSKHSTWDWSLTASGFKQSIARGKFSECFAFLNRVEEEAVRFAITPDSKVDCLAQLNGMEGFPPVYLIQVFKRDNLGSQIDEAWISKFYAIKQDGNLAKTLFASSNIGYQPRAILARSKRNPTTYLACYYGWMELGEIRVEGSHDANLRMPQHWTPNQLVHEHYAGKLPF